MAGLASLGYGFGIEPTWLRVREVDVPMPGLPAAFDGFTIAQLSDLHLSEWVSADFLRTAVAAAMECRPDMVALTGDYITCGERWISPAAEVVSGLRAPAGVFAVTGNHDFQPEGPPIGGTERRPGLGDLTEAELRRAGAVVLRGDQEEIRRGGAVLQIVGCDDLWFDETSVQRTADLARPDLATVALAHNPDCIDVLGGAAVELVLSGHTHGGQVNIPLYGPPILPVRNRALVSGLYTVGRTRIHVSPGVGNLLGVRFGARPEVTILRLRPAPKSAAPRPTTRPKPATRPSTKVPGPAVPSPPRPTTVRPPGSVV